MKKKHNFYILIALFIFFSCSNTTELDEGLVDNFDRQQILENVTDNIILPAFEDFTQKIVELEESVTLFTNSKNPVNLEEVQARWFEAYKIWQHIEMFNISKAEEVYLSKK
jgi:predicted lipoprotein